MPVIGLTITSMEARREKGPAQGEIKVNSTPKISDVKEVNVPSLHKKAIAITFEFVTNYEPKIGEVKLTGEVMYLAEKNATILSQWKKKKSLPEKVSIEVLNHLFRRCLLKASNMADDLQLPPPLQLPRVKPASDSAGYIG
jgi:hypothetical protein